MKDYDFTLKYRLADPSADPETYIEALTDAGCDDALIGIGKEGRIALDFCRSAKSAWDAITTAISDVREAIPDAQLVEATPDYVGLTDIAELFGFSRQYMRKLVSNKGPEFPEPIHEGKPTLWHLTEVLSWFENFEKREIDQNVLEISRANMQINVLKSCLRASSFLEEGFQFWIEAPTKSLQRALDLSFPSLPLRSVAVKRGRLDNRATRKKPPNKAMESDT